LGFDTFNEKLSGAYPTRYSEEGELLYHVMLFLVKAEAKKIPNEGKAIGKINEYRFFTKKQLEKLKIIPSNKQPILDAFSDKNNIKIQDL